MTLGALVNENISFSKFQHNSQIWSSLNNLDFVCFVDSFHFALQMHLTPHSFGIKNELIPLTCLGLGLGKGDKVMEKDQVQP